MLFGERLRELREDKGLRPEDVAAQFGFGVTVDYLLGRTLIPYIEIEIDGVETLEDARALGKKIGEEIAARSIPINTTCRIVGGRRKFLLFYLPSQKTKRTGD